MLQSVHSTTVAGQTLSVRYVERFHCFNVLDMHPLAAASRSRLLETEPKLFVFVTSYYACVLWTILLSICRFAKVNVNNWVTNDNEDIEWRKSHMAKVRIPMVSSRWPESNRMTIPDVSLRLALSI